MRVFIPLCEHVWGHTFVADVAHSLSGCAQHAHVAHTHARKREGCTHAPAITAHSPRSSGAIVSMVQRIHPADAAKYTIMASACARNLRRIRLVRVSFVCVASPSRTNVAANVGRVGRYSNTSVPQVRGECDANCRRMRMPLLCISPQLRVNALHHRHKCAATEGRVCCNRGRVRATFARARVRVRHVCMLRATTERMRHISNKSAPPNVFAKWYENAHLCVTSQSECDNGSVLDCQIHMLPTAVVHLTIISLLSSTDEGDRKSVV